MEIGNKGLINKGYCEVIVRSLSFLFVERPKVLFHTTGQAYSAREKQYYYKISLNPKSF